ncbi:MAG TPA: acireductone synthase [Phycisphaerae bacterium]|nr:acireductone synthase [Phycisphaerales bacterium]HRX85437.1 acireductone synthase [Phycisphaerae bacterium]
MSNVAAILLDIEGTIAPIAFVYDVLFPYARRELPAYVADHWAEPDVQTARAQVAADAGVADFSREALTGHLMELMDRDAKTTGLKELQGLVWARGYAEGALRSQLFPDVPPALRRWHDAGIRIAIYSSGSAAAQRVFLAHTEFGDLTRFFDGFFDTTSGPKKEAQSYRRIAAKWQQPAESIAFFSDVTGELDAAEAAGMRSVLVERPGNAPVADGSHARITSLEHADAHLHSA